MFSLKNRILLWNFVRVLGESREMKQGRRFSFYLKKSMGGLKLGKEARIKKKNETSGELIKILVRGDHGKILWSLK